MTPHTTRMVLISVVVVVSAMVLYVTTRVQKPPPPHELTAQENRAVLDLMVAAGEVAESLASDSLTDYNLKISQLPERARTAKKVVANDDPWHEHVKRAVEHSDLPEARTLEEARKAFLPFSTAMADLAREARSTPEFREVKVFRCPMVAQAWAGAPENGYWVQVHGKVRNPWFGKDMLDCGVEVQ